MSENNSSSSQLLKSPWLPENYDKIVEIIKGANTETKKAKEEYSEAQRLLKEEPTDSEKIPVLKADVEKAKVNLDSKRTSELTKRIKGAQGASKEGYTPEDNEKHLFIVRLDNPFYDSKTGKKVSKAWEQKYTDVEFKQFYNQKGRLGLEVEILWNPEIYNIKF